MSTELLDIFDSLREKILSLSNELKHKNEENLFLSKKNEDLEYDLKNLNKVSMVAVLSRQIDDKNNKIEFLEKQINNLKNKKNITELKDEAQVKFKIEDGFELINYENIKLLKDTENRKLYFSDDKGTKGKYAGKETKKGKIKLKD